MPFLVSIIVCTRDPRPDFIRRTIDAIKNQSMPPSEWELLVVDNKSDAPLAGALDLSWHPGARIIREETPGLTHARIRGFSEASSELLVYVDDDNVLAPDYLANALRLARDMPFIGVWSASIRGEFEVQPEPWMKPYLPYLALTEFDTDRWANHPHGQTLPIGAGMVVRRGVLSAYHEILRTDPRKLGLDRTKDSLLAGGDTDIGLAACSIGLGCAYMTTLRVTHLIPAARLQRSYLTRLLRDVTASHHWLDLSAGKSNSCSSSRRGRIGARLEYYGGPINLLRFIAAKIRGRSKAAVLFREDANKFPMA